MSSLAIISIKSEFSDQIISGNKTIELRRSTMGLNKDDVVLVYSSWPDQCLKFWFRINHVELCNVKEMWEAYHTTLGIDQKRYFEYFEGTRLAIGIHLGNVCVLRPSINLEMIRKWIPNFVPPQGILWIENKIEKFRILIKKIQPPLPKDVLRQMSLFSHSEKEESHYLVK